MNAQRPPDAYQERMQLLATVFRPSGPIDQQDLFSGRINQLAGVGDLCAEMGLHGVIYGERGVGKTSLAAVSSEIQKIQGKLSIRINCDTSDNFKRIWEKVIDEFTVVAKFPSNMDNVLLQEAIETAVAIWHFDDEIGPDRVRHGLQVLASVTGVVIFFDEFDRVLDQSTHTLFADTIKTLSDQLVDATLVLVGVADSVEALIAEHISIERALAQIQMPRMSPDEIQGIYTRGFSALGISVDRETCDLLIKLPQGLPHYAHLLARESARIAILGGDDTISYVHFQMGLEEAVSKVDQSITRAYSAATTSSRETIFEEVLLACALATSDDFGYSAPPDIRTPLSAIMNEFYDLPRFAGHLFKLCEERGKVLERRGGERKWRYRFANPMMQPYVLMRAVKSGRLSTSDLPTSS